MKDMNEKTGSGFDSGSDGDEITIGFAGMSHLGIVSAVAAAAKGFKVVGFDQDEKLVSHLKAGAFPIYEPDLNDLAEKNLKHLSFTSSVSDLARCQVIYISLDIKTDEKNNSDLSAIHALIAQV